MRAAILSILALTATASADPSFGAVRSWAYRTLTNGTGTTATKTQKTAAESLATSTSATQVLVVKGTPADHTMVIMPNSPSQKLTGLELGQAYIVKTQSKSADQIIVGNEPATWLK